MGRTTAAARQVGAALHRDFPVDAATTLAVVTTRPLDQAAAADYSARLSEVGGVTAVAGPAGTWVGGHLATPAALRQPGGSGWWSVSSSADPEGASGTDQVRAVRALPVPGGATALVGGPAATLVDLEHSMGSRLPLAGALIALVTCAVLLLYTGSVLLPLKALALNAVSLGAVLGVTVWIFQDGHLAGLLGTTPAPLAIAMPVLLFVIAFGLSMDYEVFVLSRVTELHDAGADDTDAVSHGLARSGRIVSTAAALLSVTFFAFGTSRLPFLQLFGIGTGLAVLVDATLVRGVLVPAVMGLAGPLNWWAPAPLRHLRDALGAHEGAPGAPVGRPVG